MNEEQREQMQEIDEAIDEMYGEVGAARRDVLRASMVTAHELSIAINVLRRELRQQLGITTDLHFGVFGADIAGAAIITVAIADAEEKISHAMALLSPMAGPDANLH